MNSEFGWQIGKQIELVNLVLQDLNRPQIFANKDFVIDRDSAGFYQLIAAIERPGANIIPCRFHFEGDGLRIDLNDIDETFEWPFREIEARGDVIGDFIKDLFRSFIVLETSNAGITANFFDVQGRIRKVWKLRSASFFSFVKQRDPEQHLFFPIYQ